MFIGAEIVERPGLDGTPVSIVQFSSSCSTAVIAYQDGRLGTIPVQNLRLRDQNMIASVVMDNLAATDRHKKEKSTSKLKEIKLLIISVILFLIGEK